MAYIGYLILGLAIALLAMQWRMAQKAKALEGTALPELEPDIEGKLKQRGRVLLYFFSPSCGPCRAYTPLIERAATRHDNVFKFDITRSTDLARRLGVMATPTTVLLAGNQVARVALGPMSESKLEEMLS